MNFNRYYVVLITLFGAISLSHSYLQVKKISICNYSSMNSHRWKQKVKLNSVETFATSLPPLQIKSIQRETNKDFIRLSVPAFFALAVEPAVSFSESAVIGRLGTQEQAGIGIANSAQYSVSKLYNDPLLKISTSLVAGKSGDDLSTAVATAFLSAAAIGLIQSTLFMGLSESILKIMGVLKSSDISGPAISYLRWRALGIPAATVAIVSNGIFRGRGDTRTPLYCTILACIVQIFLTPLFIHRFKLGSGGAGAANSVAQWVGVVPLLYQLHKIIPFNIFNQDAQKLKAAFSEYWKAGSLILIRTIAKTVSYSVPASIAAQLGTVVMAAYSITFNLGFIASQLCESVAISSHSLLAKHFPYDTPEKRIAARHVIKLSFVAGIGLSLALMSITGMNMNNILDKMTTSPEVRAAISSIIPIVLFTQAVKGISTTSGNLLLGGHDWIYSTMSMNIAALALLSTLYILPHSLKHIWTSLAAFMCTQVFIASVRIFSSTGPWKRIWSK